MSVTVRPLRKDDRTYWEGLWSGYLEFYQAPMEAVVIELTWSRLLDEAEPMVALVAEDDESKQLLGLTHCVFHRGTWAINDLCYLEDLYVSKAARGRKIGRALIEAVYALADGVLDDAGKQRHRP